MKNKITDLLKFLSTHIPLTSWDYEGFKTIAPEGLYDAQQDWNQTLVTKINQTSATIFQDTMKGGANVILISSNLENLFRTLEYFTPEKSNILHGVKDGRCQVYEKTHDRYGTIAGRFQVYSIPDLTKVMVEMYDSKNELKKVVYEESKFFVCKLKDPTKIFDIKNYIKVGVIKVSQLIPVNLIE